MPDAVDDDESLEGAPYIGVAQDRQKGGEAGARGEEPQVRAGREGVDGEKAQARSLDFDRVAHAKAGEAPREFAARYQGADELGVRLRGRRRNR